MRTSTKLPKKINLPAPIINQHRQNKKKHSPFKISLLICLVFSINNLQEAWAQRTFLSNCHGADKSWTDPDAWLMNGSIATDYPKAGDIVIIDFKDGLTLNQTATCASIEIRNTGNNGTSALKIGSYTLTTNSLTISGGTNSSNNSAKAKVQIGTGTLIVNGNLVFNRTSSTIINATVEFTGAGGNLQIAGTLDNDGNFTRGAGTVTFNGSSAQTIPMNYDYANLKINNYAGVTPDNNITPTNVSGNITVENGILNNGGFNIAGAAGQTFEVKSGATFIASGTSSIASGTSSFPTGFTPNLGSASIVKYTGTNQSVAGVTYGNLIIEGSGTKTLTDNMFVAGNFSVKTGTFNNGGFSITGTGAATKNFELLAGTTFIASNTSTLPTDFTNTILESNSTVNYTGNNQQIAPATYSNLTLGTGTKTLLGNVTITKPLNINGSISLGTHNLTIQSTGSITGYNSTNFIQQPGSGKLIIELPTNSAAEVLFPVGTSSSSYTPAYIKNVGSPAYYSVHVSDGIKDNNNQPVTNLVVKKTWDVKNETYPTGNITLRLQWNNDPAELGTGFDPLNAGIVHFTSEAWQYPATFGNATTTSPYSISLADITTFSKFGVSNPNSPLPVELISFTVTKKDNAAYLQWATASEKNNEGFHIQTSTDGKNFENIGFVASRNPNSVTQQQYEFLDKTTRSGLRYYRLKQMDFDGKVSYSGIKVLNFDKRHNGLVIYPNPFNRELNFSIHTDKNDELRYQIVDVTGKTVYENAQKLIKGNNAIQINLDEKYPAGVYLLKTQSSDSSTATRILRQ